jgi:hypothetical protein
MLIRISLKVGKPSGPGWSSVERKRRQQSYFKFRADDELR